MDDAIRRALATDRTIDITTTGRRGGQPRRVEIWFHRLDGQIYITGTPGPRDWYANLITNPVFTVHLKQSLHADLPARATPITDPAARRARPRSPTRPPAAPSSPVSCPPSGAPATLTPGSSAAPLVAVTLADA